MDIISRVYQFPEAGETVKGMGTEYVSGGKGANQAIASALAGGNVTMVGAIGNDVYAEQLLKAMSDKGVRTDHIMSKDGNSGMAFITVNHQGENTIILSEGANGLIYPGDIPPIIPLIEQADLLLLQNEIPWETNRTVIEEANRRGVYIIYNPAPAFSIPNEMLEKVDLLILNETEIETITGMAVQSSDQAERALLDLIAKGAKEVILTLGNKGASYMDQSRHSIDVPAFRVESVDTTAAGDTYIGALAAVLRSPMTIEEKLRFASAAAAIAVTRKGAASSIPNREEIELFLQRHNEISGR
jgi:ribokinase